MKRAQPGDADAITTALTPTLRAALDELRELLDVWDWQETPLAPPFQCAAAILLARRYHDEGMSPTGALESAADDLDLERETVRTWCRRWSEASRVHHAPDRPPGSAASYVEDAATTPRPDRAA